MWVLFAVPLLTFLFVIYLALDQAIFTDQPIDLSLISGSFIVVGGGMSIVILILGGLYIIGPDKITAQSSNIRFSEKIRWPVMLVSIYLTALILVGFFLTETSFLSNRYLENFAFKTNTLRLIVLACIMSVPFGAVIAIVISALDKKATTFTGEGVFRYTLLYILCFMGCLVVIQLDKTRFESFSFLLGIGMFGLLKVIVWALNLLLGERNKTR